jgi:hypothetical protein
MEFAREILLRVVSTLIAFVIIGIILDLTMKKECTCGGHGAPQPEQGRSTDVMMSDTEFQNVISGFNLF